MTEKPILDIKTVCQKLQLQDKHIINAYLLGSRLWKTNSPDSDFDLLLVVDDKTPALTASSQKGFANIHAGNIDALLISNSLYMERIRACNMFELLTLWLPQAHVLRRTVDPVKKWQYDAKLLDKATRETVDRDWRMAQKYFEKGNPDRGKKTIVHAIRLVMLSLQIINSDPHRITDYTAAKDIFDEMRNMFNKDWETYDSIYRPILDDLLNQLQEAVNS